VAPAICLSNQLPIADMVPWGRSIRLLLTDHSPRRLGTPVSPTAPVSPGTESTGTGYLS